MAMSGERIARRLVIGGRVQGVGYRDWTVATARGFGLDGWVRNRRDGGVEALLAGDAAAVAAMVAACRRGPPHARVVRVDDEPAALPAQAGFTRRPDA
jgi:acylphosphatase